MSRGLAAQQLVGPDHRYRLLKPVAYDPLGSVWTAEDRSWNRMVTLRIIAEPLASNEGFMSRLQSAIEPLLRPVSSGGSLRLPLSHPEAAQILGFHEGNPSFPPIAVMEPIDGLPLAALLERQGRLPATTAAGIALLVAGAIHAGNQAGIVHGCVNPANVLVSAPGTVKIIDFGLTAVWVSTPGLATSHGYLTAFIAPEVFAGARPGLRSDVFSVGAVMYAMLTGHPPEKDASGKIEAGSLLALGVSEEIERVCRLSLASNPQLRLSSSGVFASQLALAIGPFEGTGQSTLHDGWRPLKPRGQVRPETRREDQDPLLVLSESSQPILSPVQPASVEAALRRLVLERDKKPWHKRRGPAEDGIELRIAAESVPEEASADPPRRRLPRLLRWTH